MLFEGVAVGVVDLALIAAGALNMQLLSHLVEPSGLIAARHPDDSAALGELIEPTDFRRQANRIPSRQHVADRSDLDVFGVHRDVHEQGGDAAHLQSLGAQVMLGAGNRFKAQVVGDVG
jgi:hypothetical protein